MSRSAIRSHCLVVGLSVEWAADAPSRFLPDMSDIAVTSSSPVVSLKDVQKSFGPLKVLDGVSFTVERGQVLALIGRSGSGKSTALRCIDRFEKVDSGEIIV